MQRTLTVKTVVLNPLGADGSAAATVLVPMTRAGILRNIRVVYTNQTTGTLTIKDIRTGKTLFTAASNATSIGSTIPAAVVTDGVDEANGATADNSVGIPFASHTQLEVKAASFNGSTTNAKPVVVSMFIEHGNVEYHEVLLRPTGAAGSAVATWDFYPQRANGNGILRFLHLKYGASVPNTTDITIKDRLTTNTLFTATNCNTEIGPCSVTTDAVDEANGNVNDLGAAGLPFYRGLRLAVAQADPSKTAPEPASNSAGLNITAAGANDIIARYWVTI